MRALIAARRRGATLRDTVAVCLLLLCAAALILPACYHTRDGCNRTGTCQSNVSNLCTAMILYEHRKGRLPGYMNALDRLDGSLYVDPDTGRPTPVSWAVELLADLDRGALYEIWRSAPQPIAESSATPTAAGTAKVPATDPRKVYLEILTCPSSPNDRRDAVLNYVVNTGMPDLLQATPERDGKPGTPRDWPANGVFFDDYSESPLVKPDPQPRAPRIRMTLSGIRDPKDRTILVTENLDAGPYAFRPSDLREGNPALSEILWGCTWRPGPIETQGNKPMMSPGEGSHAPNVGIGRKQPVEYLHARPSALHPRGFVVGFASRSVLWLNPKISYLVYAKLMASDDADAKLPGSDELLDRRWRDYSVTDADLFP